jgi:Domain of unknown function (DU1801)
MAELKTKPTDQSVEKFIGQVSDEEVRDDCYELVKLMTKVTGSKPKMWGPSIVGFGKYHYKYDSGHEGDMCITGFSPRKQNLTLYVMAPFPGQAALLTKLGKHRASKACLYIKRLSDVDMQVLEQLVSQSVGWVKQRYNS